MGTISKDEIIGALKGILIIGLCLGFIVTYVIFDRSESISSWYEGGILLIIGIAEMIIGIGGIRLLDWLSVVLDKYEKTTKADRDAVETKNISEEPKKKSNVQKLKDKISIKKKVPESNLPGSKVEFGGTPLDIGTPAPEIPIKEEI